MKKIEVILRPEKLEDVKEILNQSNVHGLTVTMVSGCGHQKGKREIYRGTEITMNLLPKIKVETVVRDELVAGLVDKITAAVRTGSVGDGKIFIYTVEEVIRIRTGESGENAL